MHLNQSLLRALALFPEKEAIADGQKKFTYKELGQRVSALIEALREIGLGKGSVIACLAPNGHEYLELYYATSFMAAVINPLNIRISPNEIRDILNDCSADAVVVHTDYANEIAEALKGNSTVKNVLWLGPGSLPTLQVKSHKLEPFLLGKWGASLPEPVAVSEDLAQLYYTSGTTGQAKGVMLTQDNAATNAFGAIAELGLNDGDVWLHVAPMFHLVDAWAVWAITWVGGKHVFLPQFSAQSVLPTLERENVTMTALVPTMLTSLLNSHNVWEYSYAS